MEIKLKKVNFIDRKCFDAIVCINGRDEFYVSNMGLGGKDEYSSCKGHGIEHTWIKIESINEKLGGKEKFQAIVHKLLNDSILRIRTQKILRNVSYVRDGKVFVMPYENTPENIKRLKNKEWWKEDNIVLNELDFNNAITYLKE